MGAPGPEPRAYLPLHPLEFRVLLALIEGTRHGYDIVKEIERRSGSGRIFPANLYRRIRNLLRDGLLEKAEAPTKSDVDPRRRYFRLTELGLLVARAEAARLEDLLVDARAKKLLVAPPGRSKRTVGR